MINDSILSIVEKKAGEWFKAGCLYKSDVLEDDHYDYLIENGWEYFDSKSFLEDFDVKNLDTLSPEARIMIFTMSIHHNINFFEIAKRVSFLDSGKTENHGYYVLSLIRILTSVSSIVITSRAWLALELAEEKLTQDSFNYFKSIIDRRDIPRLVNVCKNIELHVFKNNVEYWMKNMINGFKKSIEKTKMLNLQKKEENKISLDKKTIERTEVLIVQLENNIQMFKAA